MPLRLLVPLLLIVPGCRPPSGVPGTTPAPSPHPSKGALRVHFLDVGQGDAAFAELPGGGSLLIDGGPPEAGPRVLEALRAAGVRKLDWLVGSHPHADHIGGLVDVLREMPAERTLDPGYNHGTSLQRTYLQLLKKAGGKTERARAGQTYDLGAGASLEILAPAEPLLKGTESDANNNSIVARLVFGKRRFLFTGDMQDDERARLMRSASAAKLRADVLKVAHHGSHNGTDGELLRAVDPEYAVISLARGNDYGHPHREAMAALQDHGAPILRTDELGTIVFTTDGESLNLEGPAASAAASESPGRTPGARRPAPAQTRPATAGRVIGNEASRVYHRPDCESLPSPDRRVEFKSAGAAEKQGYRPHRACTR